MILVTTLQLVDNSSVVSVGVLVNDTIKITCSGVDLLFRFT